MKTYFFSFLFFFGRFKTFTKFKLGAEKTHEGSGTPSPRVGKNSRNFFWGHPLVDMVYWNGFFADLPKVFVIFLTAFRGVWALWRVYPCIDFRNMKIGSVFLQLHFIIVFKWFCEILWDLELQSLQHWEYCWRFKSKGFIKYYILSAVFVIQYHYIWLNLSENKVQTCVSHRNFSSKCNFTRFYRDSVISMTLGAPHRAITNHWQLCQNLTLTTYYSRLRVEQEITFTGWMNKVYILYIYYIYYIYYI